MFKKKIRYHLPLIVSVLFIFVLLLIPTGYEDNIQYKDAERCVAKVTAVDNSSIIDTGLVRSGEQICQVEFLNGLFKNKTAQAVNILQGSLEQDKLFSVNDKAQVVISHSGNAILRVSMIDHFRVPGEMILAVLFIVFLIVFAGWTGVRAVFSFGLTVLTIWKILVPVYLNGWNPVWGGLGITLFLTTFIIALVYGFDHRWISAVSGAFLGILVTCVLGILFTDLFQIHGAIMSSSESLLYAGYQHLNLTQIFMASIFLGSSGAMMDLSVDITSAVYEVIEKKPDISSWEAVKSGLNIGRAAMGTMTTTLLLAYSGGYIALLMVFMAQGTPVEHIFNYKYVAAEIIHTVVGSFGLVSVAPFTALCAGIILTKRNGKIREILRGIR